MLETDKGHIVNTHFIVASKAKLPVFDPVHLNGSDRFGNFLRRSHEFAYKNRESEYVRAAILISPEGRSFIAARPGVLRKIERALTVDPQGTGPAVKLDTDLTISPMEQLGFNSIPRMVDVSGELYVVKTPKKVLPGQTKNHQQPYIAEMLQIMALSNDLEAAFKAHGIRLLPPLFASGQLSFTEFVAGDHPGDTFFRTIVWICTERSWTT